MKDYSQVAHDLAIIAMKHEIEKGQLSISPDDLATTYHDYFHDYLLELKKYAPKE